MGYWNQRVEDIEKELDTDLKNGLNAEKLADKRGTFRI